jgi:hypothetical protein
MRLLQRSETGEITLSQNFAGEDSIPLYAILSHTWGLDNEEVTYEDMVKGTSVEKQGYRKIAYGCEQASRDGLHYIWVDTCCIDKSSSSELSESINSMYAWYKRSKVCYVYLNDVTATKDPPYILPAEEHLEEEEERRLDKSDFAKSRWFTRGWTLQELLAPDNIEFFSKDWTHLGNLKDVLTAVLHITNIDRQALVRDRKCFKLSDICVARRMSWAAKRHTGRVEDRAYSLMGIFGVHMPLIYGEGSYAFVRLQEEILKRSDDDSILVWNTPNHVTPENDVRHDELLAPSPSYFVDCDKLIRSSWVASTEPMLMSNLGLTITTSIILIEPENEFGRTRRSTRQRCFVVLECRDQDDPDQVLALSGWYNSDLKVQALYASRDRTTRISKLSQLELDCENHVTVSESVNLRRHDHGDTFETRLFAEPVIVVLDTTHCDVTIKDYYPSKAWVAKDKKLVVTEYSSATHIAAVRLTFRGDDLLLVLGNISRGALMYSAGMVRPILFRCPRGAHSTRSLVSRLPKSLPSERHVYQGPLEFRYVCREGDRHSDEPIIKAYLTSQPPQVATQAMRNSMAPSKEPSPELIECDSADYSIYRPLNHTYQ